jgi:hypothetical protein
VLLAGLFLLIGCSARYFFAPFAITVFIGVWLAYGRRTAFTALPAFVAAALFFVGYQKFNVDITGFGTGIPRIPAPESFGYLTLKFVMQLVKESLWFGIAAWLLLWLARKQGPQPFQTSVAASGESDARACRLLLFSGLGFLLLAFYLRTKTQYDLYSPRTVSYGLTFAAAACIGLMTRARTYAYPVWPVALYGAFTLFVAQDLLLPFQLKESLTGGHVFPAQALNGYHSAATPADVIVSLQVPDLTPMADGFASLYYPKGKTILTISAAPYGIPDTLADLRARIASHGGSCVVDFTPFSSRKNLQDYVNQMYPVEFRFASLAHTPDTIQRPDFDPSVKNYLLSIFQPGRYVPCST